MTTRRASTGRHIFRIWAPNLPSKPARLALARQLAPSRPPYGRPCVLSHSLGACPIPSLSVRSRSLTWPLHVCMCVHALHASENWREKSSSCTLSSSTTDAYRGVKEMDDGLDILSSHSSVVLKIRPSFFE